MQKLVFAKQSIWIALHRSKNVGESLVDSRGRGTHRDGISQS